MDHIVDQNTFAGYCGVDARTIRRWMENGLPADKPARNTVLIDLRQGIPWVRDNIWMPSLDDRARKLKAEADITEMQRDTMRGKLLDATEAKEAWSKVLLHLRGRILSISGTIAAQMVDGLNVGERKALIDDSLHLVLLALSQGEEIDDVLPS